MGSEMNIGYSFEALRDRIRINKALLGTDSEALDANRMMKAMPQKSLTYRRHHRKLEPHRMTLAIAAVVAGNSSRPIRSSPVAKARKPSRPNSR